MVPFVTVRVAIESRIVYIVAYRHLCFSRILQLIIVDVVSTFIGGIIVVIVGIAVLVIYVVRTSHIVKIVSGDDIVAFGAEISVQSAVLKDGGISILVGNAQALSHFGPLFLGDFRNSRNLHIADILIIHSVPVRCSYLSQLMPAIGKGGFCSVRIGDGGQIVARIIGKGNDFSHFIYNFR